MFSWSTYTPPCSFQYLDNVFDVFSINFRKLSILNHTRSSLSFCCSSRKVQLALDIVNQISEDGLSLSIDMLSCILHAIEENYECNLVWRIYSVICCHNLKPNAEAFRRMIILSVKMKDFDGAYAMLNDSRKMNVKPVAGMYNAIMAGYFREKKISASEEDIIKYYEELKCSGITVTKHIFMSLISAYAACGQFEKAKQVLLDEGIPVKSLNELRSAHVSSLASNGQMVDALDTYEEIKQSGGDLEPRAVLSLMECLHSDGDLNLMLQLLET
ncbi:hypothetical protein SLA2020_007910 [Shorea laevis]